jgi:vacuolar iron transporter family protein
MPLLGYVLIPLLFPELNTEELLFTTACVVTAVTLFFMGAVKSFFSTQSWYYAGFETLLLGGACATVAYTIGQLVEHVYGASSGEQ